MTGNDGDAPNRAVRLFKFLAELGQLTTKACRTMDAYEKVIFLHEVPKAPEVHRMAWRDDDGAESSEIWLQIKKPVERKSYPKVPAPLTPWIKRHELGDSDLEAPSLNWDPNQMPLFRPEDLGHGFDDLDSDHGPGPELISLWDDYVAQQWRPWAEADRRRKAVQRIYAELFSLYQKQRQVGEEYEVVVGIGLLGWHAPDRHKINRHILVARADIGFDSVKGIITIRPPGDGAGISLEQDMLESDQRPTIANSEFKDFLDEIGDAIWDRGRLAPPLKSWIHSLSADGIYYDDLEPHSAWNHVPTLRLAPAIILRKRDAKSIVSMHRAIAEQIEEGQEPTDGILKLIGLGTNGAHNWGGGSTGIEEIYFPKPFNREQKEIVEKISSSPGLVVQGPPGTGKSHTIANLVCHLLAIGKKVLVTSRSSRALRVLKKQIPKGISDLCISLLDDDRDSLKELEAAVAKIIAKKNNWQRSLNDEEIKRFEKELQEVRSLESKVVRDIRIIREIEFKHERRFSCYEGTASQIARKLSEEEADFMWMPERPGEDIEPPLCTGSA